MTEARKKWLWSFIAYVGSGLIFNSVVLIIGANEDKILSGCMLPWLFVWGWITYYCAFRKRGTSWLKFLLFALPYGTVKSLMSELKEINSWNSLGVSIFVGITACSLAVDFWFWLNCLRYRRENLALKNQIKSVT